MSLKSGDLFPTEVITEVFSKVKGHSTLAKLSAQTPIPFTGTTEYIFDLKGNAQIVGEGELKKPGEATLTPKVIKPIKFVYQSRVSDEFKKASLEKQLKIMEQYLEGYSIVMARSFDIAAIHGLEPQSMTDASFKANNSFDGLVTGNVITFDAAKVEDNIEEAVAMVNASDSFVNGLALSPTAGTALSKITVNGVRQYPEFRFGQNPNSFYGMTSDINRTLTTTAGTARTDHAIVGDFQNAFSWGYTEEVPLEIIEYGDPDGIGRDLKAYNEVLLRAETYMGWGILDADSFARVEEA